MDDDRVLTTMSNKSNELANDDSTRGIRLGKKKSGQRTKIASRFYNKKKIKFSILNTFL